MKKSDDDVPFSDLRDYSDADVEAAIVRDQPDELLHVPIAVSTSHPSQQKSNLGETPTSGATRFP